MEKSSGHCPNVVINGVTLTFPQVMTFHVAMQDFAHSLQKVGALGDDEHGEFMRKAYLKNVGEITGIYMK